jgi:Domain of unknown function (DUF4048)
MPSQDTAPKRRSMPPPSREALLRTSKQMASDFREGLWTFFEDLRQATVGDEGINGTESRAITTAPTASKSKPQSKFPRQPKHKSNNSPPEVEAFHQPVEGSFSKGTSVLGSGEGHQSALVDVGNDFWSEYGVMQNKSSTPVRPRTSRQAVDLDLQAQPKSDVYDNWDIWDSPLPQTKGLIETSPTTSQDTFSTQRDSPCTNASSAQANFPMTSFSRPKSKSKSNVSP